jgi:hypothetical protein
MGAAETLATLRTELLTWVEIQARFPYQYVVVLEENEDIVGGKAALRGRVLDHDASPQALVRRNDVWRDPGALVGLYYTGVGMPDEVRDPIRVHR